MRESKLPACRHRGADLGGDRWICHSQRLVIPGRTVDAEMCTSLCPYVDHGEPEENRPSVVELPAHLPHPQMSVEEFLRRSAHSTQDFADGWPAWEVAQLAHQRRLQSAVRAATPEPPPFEGKGIVMAAGGPIYFRCAYVVASLLRKLGCRLPIEFWHLGPEELDERMAALVAPLDVTCRDARAILPPPRRLAGWELKPWAILHSAFEDVLFLDADNLPVRDPTDLFESEVYQEFGAVFWPDLDASLVSTGRIGSATWDIAQIEWREGPTFDSGQILVNKSRCWRELQLTMHFNEHSDFWYHYVYGDKDTFKLAWHKLNRAYGLPQAKAEWQWPAIHQFDLAGQLLFTHACQGKPLILGGDRVLGYPHAREASRVVRFLNSELGSSPWKTSPVTKAGNAVSPAVFSLISDIPCRHRGDILSQTEKPPANRPPVYQCELHGSCTLHQTGLHKSCVGCEDWLITTPAQPESIRQVTGLEPDPHQFNASILRFRGQSLMAYRLKELQSEIWLCELNEAGQALWNHRIALPQHIANGDGTEDPRLFIHHHHLYLTYAGIRRTPKQVLVSNFYCRLNERFEVTEHFQPHYAGSQPQEKNWQYFESQGQLFAIYTIAPHVVLKISGNHATEVSRQNWPVLWKDGELRGGASPVLHRGEYYCFFHSASDATQPRTYALGCYTFDQDPPFAPRRVSQVPLLSPDPCDHPGGHVPYCVYPCGAIFEDGAWLISYGYYDREVRLVQFSEETVNRALADVPRGLAPQSVRASSPPSPFSPSETSR